MQYTPKEFSKNREYFPKTDHSTLRNHVSNSLIVIYTFRQNNFAKKNFGLSLCRVNKNTSTCPGGGIGRRAGLKIQ